MLKTIARTYLAISNFIDWMFEDGVPYTATTLLFGWALYFSVGFTFQHPITGNLTFDCLLWQIVLSVSLVAMIVALLGSVILFYICVTRLHRYAESVVSTPG